MGRRVRQGVRRFAGGEACDRSRIIIEFTVDEVGKGHRVADDERQLERVPFGSLAKKNRGDVGLNDLLMRRVITCFPTTY